MKDNGSGSANANMRGDSFKTTHFNPSTKEKDMAFKVGDLVEIKSLEESVFIHERIIGRGCRNMYLVDSIQGHDFEWYREDELKLIKREKKEKVK